MQANERSQGSVYMVFGVLFTIIALVALVSMVFVKSRANTESPVQQVSVSNQAPSLGLPAVSLTSGGSEVGTLALEPATTKTVYIHGQVTDANGCEDVTNTPNGTVVLHRYPTYLSTCTPDDNYCYTTPFVTSTTFTNCSGAEDLTANYEVTIPIQYFADATDSGSPYASDSWYATVTVYDLSSASDSEVDIFDIGSLAAFDVTFPATGIQDFGALTLGSNSSEQTITLQNIGNRTVDAKAQTTSADNGKMVCTGTGSANIPASNVHVSTTAAGGYAAGTPLSGTSQVDIPLNLAQQTAAISTKNSFWTLQVPISGHGGSCSNTLNLTASSTAF